MRPKHLCQTQKLHITFFVYRHGSVSIRMAGYNVSFYDLLLFRRSGISCKLLNFVSMKLTEHKKLNDYCRWVVMIVLLLLSVQGWGKTWSAEESPEFRTTKYFCKTNFNMAEIKKEEAQYVDLPKIYAFKDDRQKEIMLNRNFARVNREIDEMIKSLLNSV